MQVPRSTARYVPTGPKKKKEAGQQMRSSVKFPLSTRTLNVVHLQTSSSSPQASIPTSTSTTWDRREATFLSHLLVSFSRSSVSSIDRSCPPPCLDELTQHHHVSPSSTCSSSSCHDSSFRRSSCPLCSSLRCCPRRYRETCSLRFLPDPILR